MRLSRKQQVARNLLLAALLLFVWWFFMGTPALTASQAWKWEAQRWGLKNEPEILWQGEEQDAKRSVIFTAGSKVGLGTISRASVGYSADIDQVEDWQGLLLFWEDTFMSYGEEPDLYVLADIPNAAEVEVQLRMKDRVTAGYYNVVRSFDWDETYVFTVKPDPQGVSFFCIEGKYPENEEDWEKMVLHRAEMEVFVHFSNAVENRQPSDCAFTLTIHFRDSAGNMIETYEETIWDDLKEEAP